MALSVSLLVRYIGVPIINAIHMVVIFLIIRSMAKMTRFRRSLITPSKSIYCTTMLFLSFTALQLTALCLLTIYKVFVQQSITPTQDNLRSGLSLYLLQNYLYIVTLFTQIKVLFQHSELRLSPLSIRAVVSYFIAVPVVLFLYFAVSDKISSLLSLQIFAPALSLSVILFICGLNAAYILKLKRRHVLDLNSDDVLNTLMRRQIQSAVFVLVANITMITVVVLEAMYGTNLLIAAASVYSVTLNLSANCLSITICVPLFLRDHGNSGHSARTVEMAAGREQIEIGSLSLCALLICHILC